MVPEILELVVDVRTVIHDVDLSVGVLEPLHVEGVGEGADKQRLHRVQ